MTAKQAYCEAQGIDYHVITASDVAGYPVPAANAYEQPTSKKKVLVTGCYDWFHSGHVRFFEEASEYGDLYVVAGNDANVEHLKGAGHPMFKQDERRYIVQSIRFVTQALISTGMGWMDAEPQIALVKPDIYLVNEDGDKPEKQAFCDEHDLEYVVLKRLPKEGPDAPFQHRFARILNTTQPAHGNLRRYVAGRRHLRLVTFHIPLYFLHKSGAILSTTMSIESLAAELRDDTNFIRNVTAWQTLPSRLADEAAWPDGTGRAARRARGALWASTHPTRTRRRPSTRRCTATTSSSPQGRPPARRWATRCRCSTRCCTIPPRRRCSSSPPKPWPTIKSRRCKRWIRRIAGPYRLASLRRRHAPAPPRRHPQRSARHRLQPRYAAPGHPAAPHPLDALLHGLALHRAGRTPHLSRHLRQPRGQRFAARAAHRALLRRRSAVYLRLRHHRQRAAGWAKRCGKRPSPPSRRTARLTANATSSSTIRHCSIRRWACAPARPAKRSNW